MTKMFRRGVDAAIVSAASCSMLAPASTYAKSLSSESLKIKVEPATVSVTTANANPEFFFRISGRTVKAADLNVFVDFSGSKKCAATEPEQEAREEQEDVEPDTGQKEPKGGKDFTGDFSFFSNKFTLEPGQNHPSVYPICGYLSPPKLVEKIEPSAEEERLYEEAVARGESPTEPEAKTKPLKPLLVAHATLTVVKGKAVKKHAK